MANIKYHEPGKISLVQQLECGRIIQIGVTEEQYSVLEVILAQLSKESPFVQMGEEHDLILKSSLKKTKKHKQ